MEENGIVLSVIMLTYNHEKYIEKAINSILNQKTTIKYEIIIGDDFSQDGTQTILKRYEKKYPEIIKLVLRNKNIGVTNNFYNLLTKAKGKYIAQLEGDDYWIDEKKIEKQLKILQKFDYIAVAHGNIVINHKGEYLYNSLFSDKNRILKMKDLINTGGIFHTATLMYKNIFLNAEGKYEIIRTAHKNIGDFTLYTLLFDQGDIFYQSELMSAYRHNLENSDSISCKIRIDYIKNYIEILKLYDNLNEYFNGKYNFDNLKVIRTVELLKVYFIRKPFSKKELNEYLKQLSFLIKIKSVIKFVIETIKYLKKYKLGKKYD